MPYYFPEIESTQVFLKQLAQTEPNLKHLEYAIADLQTAGIGRHGRTKVNLLQAFQVCKQQQIFVCNGRSLEVYAFEFIQA